MNLPAITPYLTAFGLIVAVVALFDFVLKDEIKGRVTSRLFYLAQVGSRPYSLAFYGLVVLISILFTVIIISANGGLRTIQESRQSFLIALQSAGPMLLAVVFKILVWDYLVACKSFFLWSLFREARPWNWLLCFGITFYIFMDLYLTGILTAGLFNWFDLSRMKDAGDASPSFVKSLTDFFGSLNLVLRDSMQKSFYILNGSLVFYLAIAVSIVIKGALPMLDEERIKQNIFKAMGALASLVLLIVLICYQIATD